MTVKTVEEVFHEADRINRLGQENTWELPSGRYTQDELDTRGTSNIIASAVNKGIFRDGVNKNPGIQRNTLVMATTDPKKKTLPISAYEEFLLSPPAKEGTTHNKIKVKTRCAESKAYCGKPSWKYSNPSPAEIYEREINSSLQSTIFVDKGLNLKAGQFINQVYTDDTQDNAKFLSIDTERGILEDLDELAASMDPSSSTPFFGDGTIRTVAETTISDISTLPVRKKPDETPTVVEVLEKNIWKPAYNPIVVGTTIYKKPSCWSKFGPRTLSGAGTTKKGTRFHAGIDIGVRGLMPICAVADGVVVSARPITSTKISVIIIEHTNVVDVGNKGWKVKTAYMHNCKIEKGIKKGVTVNAGDIIAYVGGKPNMPGAGGTTGYHLHFEVRITNNEDQGMKLKYGTGYVDPLSFEYPKLLVIPDKKAKDIVKALQKEFFNGEKDY